MPDYRIEPMPRADSARRSSRSSRRSKPRPSATRSTGASWIAASSRCCARKRVAGTAVTLAIPGQDSTLLHHALGLLRPGDILVVDRLGDDKHACWGGGVTVAAKAAGAVAGIVDGPCTDLTEIEDSDFPLWCRGMSPITTRLYNLGGTLNLPSPAAT